MIVHPFSTESKKSHPNCLFLTWEHRHPRTRRPILPAQIVTCWSLSFLWEWALFTTWMRSGLKRQGLKCSSDSHFRCNTPLWSIWRRWSSLAFPELKFNSRHVSQLMPFLQGIKCLHTVCHWKLSIITGRHACLATTEKALILLLYFYCLFVFSYRTCLVNNCLSNWFCRIFVNTAV